MTPTKIQASLPPLTFACMECGRKFRTVRAAERAAFNGCPGCGGSDIDIDGEG